MSESKTHTIRANEETISAFKELCANFPNVDEAVQALISSYELNSAKKIMSGQETSINDFRSHADSLVRAYINALDISANTENRIYSEYKEQLESKDRTIIELQESLNKALNTNTFADENEHLQAELIQAEKNQKKLSEELNSLKIEMEFLKKDTEIKIKEAILKERMNAAEKKEALAEECKSLYAKIAELTEKNAQNP